jgi:hypothetical protein
MIEPVAPVDPFNSPFSLDRARAIANIVSDIAEPVAKTREAVAAAVAPTKIPFLEPKAASFLAEAGARKVEAQKEQLIKRPHAREQRKDRLSKLVIAAAFRDGTTEDDLHDDNSLLDQGLEEPLFNERASAKEGFARTMKKLLAEYSRIHFKRLRDEHRESEAALDLPVLIHWLYKNTLPFARLSGLLEIDYQRDSKNPNLRSGHLKIVVIRTQLLAALSLLNESASPLSPAARRRMRDAQINYTEPLKSLQLCPSWPNLLGMLSRYRVALTSSAIQASKSAPANRISLPS